MKRRYRKQICALAHLELMRTLRSRTTTVGLIIFILVALYGQWTHWQALPPRPEGDRLLGYGFFTAAILILHSGLAADHRCGSDRLMVYNLLPPAVYFSGKIIGMIATIFGLGLFSSLVTLLASLGEMNHAFWHPLYYTLIGLLFFPPLLIAELALNTRYPGLAVFAGFMLILLIISMTADPMPVIRFLGLDAQQMKFSTLYPLLSKIPFSLLSIGGIYLIWHKRLYSHYR